MPLPPFRLPGHLLITEVAVQLRTSEASVKAKIHRGPLKASWHNSELVVALADLASYQQENGVSP
jgi:hypothetical protein